jgi:hypothetical protein
MLLPRQAKSVLPLKKQASAIGRVLYTFRRPVKKCPDITKKWRKGLEVTINWISTGAGKAATAKWAISLNLGEQI